VESARTVCEPIVWLAGRGDFTRRRVINHRYGSIVAMANTPELKNRGDLMAANLPCKELRGYRIDL